jgi:hypothetical protein
MRLNFKLILAVMLQAYRVGWQEIAINGDQFGKFDFYRFCFQLQINFLQKGL